MSVCKSVGDSFEFPLYSMIVWNWNKVNSYISALKPFQSVPNRSKWPFCWGILIFKTSETSRSIGKCQRSCNFLKFKEIVNSTRHAGAGTHLSLPYTLQHPQATLRYPQNLRWGPRCLKYQNDPRLRSFWSLGNALRYKSLLYFSFTWSYCSLKRSAVLHPSRKMT